MGDALGYYYDIEGVRVESSTDSKLIGVDLDDLRHIDWSVIVAAGEHKVEPIIGGIRGGYFNVLITDESTAESLLAHYSRNAQ